jgi:hypothetical protein
MEGEREIKQKIEVEVKRKKEGERMKEREIK